MKIYEPGQIVRVTIAHKSVHAEIISFLKDRITGQISYTVFPLANPINFGVKRTVVIFPDEIEGLI